MKEEIDDEEAEENQILHFHSSSNFPLVFLSEVLFVQEVPILLTFIADLLFTQSFLVAI